MTIAPGAIVTCRQTGTILYIVVVGQAADGTRWQLRSLRIDHKGRTDQTRRIAGEGDITVIRAAPTFAPHTMIEHIGHPHEVLADLGDSVELIVPQISRALHGGGALRIVAGNTTTVPKFELVLAALLAADLEKGR